MAANKKKKPAAKTGGAKKSTKAKTPETEK